MVVALRIFGKKELSQLNTFDIILILLISNSVQNAMVGPDTSLWGGLAAATVLFALNFVIKKTIAKSSFFGNLLSDKPQILIHNGKPDFKILGKLDISHDELSEAMREHGVEHYSDVKLAMLEPDGNISIISGEHDRMRQSHFKRRRNRKNIVSV
ncbi:MAG: DUF421 domain-containing protein [Flavobacterium sp.]|uniref:DUF421 domain-containing protein n=1 Tax=Flavobacterium sp. TaxID=239 RepID=UPI001200C82F|nr:YetF domain-containing protein [Flavobacterium sp.]RZJ66678.1 MAG: DUF421 domain-containing protein [Flavobacterium sp.]